LKHYRMIHLQVGPDLPKEIRAELEQQEARIAKL
jgi:hypothetical protein